MSRLTAYNQGVCLKKELRLRAHNQRQTPEKIHNIAIYTEISSKLEEKQRTTNASET